MADAILVCEGACNPEVAAVDRAVTLWRHKSGAVLDGVMPIPPEHLVVALRSLKHMPHVVVRGNRAMCRGCFSERYWTASA